jgi:hypothetical protein
MIYAQILMMIMLGFSMGAGDAWGQGALAITPMSSQSADKQAVLRSSIQNMTAKPLVFELKMECDVDGAELSGPACAKFIRLTTDGVQKNGQYEIAANARLTISASLIGPVESYALFKPFIRPLMQSESARKSGVGFEFNYRPGFLFLLRPADDPLVVDSFATRTNDAARIASFSFDIKKFKSPHVATISAKIVHASTGQLVRFARLAEDKIIDPRREKLELEAEYAKLSDPDAPVCYELYIQEKKAGASLQKLSNCKR